MKTATLIVRQTEISKAFSEGFRLLLEDEATVLDAIRVADEEIVKKCGRFPVKKCKSLLHMVYHPHEGRFYKQVAIQAYTSADPFFNIRENVKMRLPNGATVVLVPEGGCTTDWEEPTE
jgi:hypothetical protein